MKKYNRSDVARAAHLLTSKYGYSQSDAWKQAHRWEARKVRRSNQEYIEQVNKKYRIINQIDLFKNRNKLIHFLNIIASMGVTVKRNNHYLELYVGNKFDAYVYAVNNKFAIQYNGTTFKSTLKDYVTDIIKRHGRVDGSRIRRKVEVYNETYNRE